MGTLLVRVPRILLLHRCLKRRSDEMSKLETLKLEYEDYLRNQRGLSEQSIYQCWRLADRFLEFRFKGKGLSTATRVAAGTSSCRSSSRLATNSPVTKLIPVRLPPGTLGARLTFRS
jgi:hypothetical protein